MGGPLSLKQHSSIQAWSVAIECLSTQISTDWNVETLGSASRMTEQRWSRCGVCVCVKAHEIFPSPQSLSWHSMDCIFLSACEWCMFHGGTSQENTSQWSCHTWKPIDLLWLYIKGYIDSCKLFHIWPSFPLTASYKDIDFQQSAVDKGRQSKRETDLLKKNWLHMKFNRPE